MVCLRAAADVIGCAVGAGMISGVAVVVEVVVVKVDRVMVGSVMVDLVISAGGAFCELKSVRLLKSSRSGVER